MKKPCENCKDRPTQLERFDALVETAKSYSVVLIVGVIVAGILLIFASSLFCGQLPGLEEMNLFVSIVLGIVATIVSIVSMLISFYGLEKTEESERRQHEVLAQIIEIEKDTRRSAQAIEKSMQTGLQNPNATVRDIKTSAEMTNMAADVDDADSEVN